MPHAVRRTNNSSMAYLALLKGCFDMPIAVHLEQYCDTYATDSDQGYEACRFRACREARDLPEAKASNAAKRASRWGSNLELRAPTRVKQICKAGRQDPSNICRLYNCSGAPSVKSSLPSFSTYTNTHIANMSNCCKEGFKWNGQAVGKETTLGKNPAYVTGDNKDAAVLIVCDIFGWKLPNVRLLADHYAKEANVTVYVPD